MMGKGELGIKVCNWLIKEKEFDLKCIVPVIPEPDWSKSIIDYAKSKNITYLDSGNINDLGKPTSLDIKKNILTLPYIYMLNNLNDSKRRKLLRQLKYYVNKRNLNKIKHIIMEHGGIDYTENKINEFSEKAINILGNFSDSKYKDALISIVEFNKSRNY